MDGRFVVADPHRDSPRVALVRERVQRRPNERGSRVERHLSTISGAHEGPGRRLGQRQLAGLRHDADLEYRVRVARYTGMQHSRRHAPPRPGRVQAKYRLSHALGHAQRDRFRGLGRAVVGYNGDGGEAVVA